MNYTKIRALLVAYCCMFGAVRICSDMIDVLLGTHGRTTFPFFFR